MSTEYDGKVYDFCRFRWADEEIYMLLKDPEVRLINIYTVNWSGMCMIGLQGMADKTIDTSSGWDCGPRRRKLF